MLVGVASTGIGCADCNVPGLYVRTSVYADLYPADTVKVQITKQKPDRDDDDDDDGDENSGSSGEESSPIRFVVGTVVGVVLVVLIVVGVVFFLRKRVSGPQQGEQPGGDPAISTEPRPPLQAQNAPLFTLPTTVQDGHGAQEETAGSTVNMYVPTPAPSTVGSLSVQGGAPPPSTARPPSVQGAPPPPSPLWPSSVTSQVAQEAADAPLAASAGLTPGDQLVQPPPQATQGMSHATGRLDPSKYAMDHYDPYARSRRLRSVAPDVRGAPPATTPSDGFTGS